MITLRSKFTTVVTIMLVSTVMIMSTTVSSHGATKLKHFEGSKGEIFIFSNSVSCTINADCAINLYYMDTSTTRKFSKHCYSMRFTSPNSYDAYSQVDISMGILSHYNPTNQIKCPNNPNYGHAMITPTPYVKYCHSDSGVTVSHKLGSTGRCQVAYAMKSGALFSKSYTFKFTGIAK